MNNTEKKYRVLQVHNYYQLPGGEDTVVANEKSLLEDYGYTVIQYTRNNNELKKFSKLQKLQLPITTIFNPKTYKDIKKIIKEEMIDIVHVHNTLNLISPAVYYATLECKIPVVQTIHNFRLLCPGATFYREGKICEDCIKYGLKCAIKYGCYRGSKIQTLVCVINTWIHRRLNVYGKLNYICLTEFNKKKLLEMRQIKEKSVFVKPNFVERIENVVPCESRPNQYIFAGRLDKLKGIDTLLETWRLMGTEAPKLIICGIGPLEDWCKEFIEKNNLWSVTMMGYMPNDKVKELISNSQALILPTQWYEGFPMTIVEAYSVGTPVIGSDIGNTGNLIDEGVSGIKFKHDSPQDLKHVIDNFKKYRFRVSDTYESKYSKELNIQALKSIYDELI